MYMKLRNSQSGKEEIAQSHPALNQTQSRLCPAPSGAATSARPPAGRSFHRAMVLCAKPSQERRVASAGHMKAGLPGAARVRTGGCARAPLPAPGSRDVAPGT